MCIKLELIKELPPSCADYLEIWGPQIHGNLRVYSGIAFCIGTCSDFVSVSIYLLFGFNWHMNFHRTCDNLKIVTANVPCCYSSCCYGISINVYDMIYLTLRRLMSYIDIYIYIYIYIYGAPILDVSRSHTTTQHSR